MSCIFRAVSSLTCRLFPPSSRRDSGRRSAARKGQTSNGPFRDVLVERGKSDRRSLSLPSTYER